MNIHVLTILSSSPKALTTRDILELCQLSGYDKEFSSFSCMQVLVYRCLKDAVRKGFAIRLNNSISKKLPYRYEISNLGLDYVTSHKSIGLLEKIMNKLVECGALTC